jgi:hypothetical protein
VIAIYFNFAICPIYQCVCNIHVTWIMCREILSISHVSISPNAPGGEKNLVKDLKIVMMSLPRSPRSSKSCHFNIFQI